MPYDGFGDGGIRPISPEAEEHTIGGGREGVPNPAVMDMVTPEGVDRADVLAEYDEDTRSAIPFVTIGELSREDLLTDVSDDESETESDGADDDTETDSSEGADSEAASDNESEAPEGEADRADNIPGFGLGAGAAAIDGGALAAKRLRDRDNS